MSLDFLDRFWMSFFYTNFPVKLFFYTINFQYYGAGTNRDFLGEKRAGCKREVGDKIW